MKLQLICRLRGNLLRDAILEKYGRARRFYGFRGSIAPVIAAELDLLQRECRKGASRRVSKRFLRPIP